MRLTKTHSRIIVRFGQSQVDAIIFGASRLKLEIDMIATRKLGDDSCYFVGISGITADGDALVFRGCAGIASSRERKPFVIRLEFGNPLLVAGDHSLVVNGQKKQVAERLLRKVRYEEGNNDFLRLSPEIKIGLW